MKSDAIIAGGVGGVGGLAWFIALAFMTCAIYFNREFDMPWLMAAHAAFVLATGALLAYAALAARLFFAASLTETAALVCGTAFAFVAIGSPLISLGIFILGPGLVLSVSVATGPMSPPKACRRPRDPPSPTPQCAV